MPIHAFYHKTFLDRSELTVQKSSSSKHIPFKRFIPSFLHAKRNWNTFLRIVSGIIRQYNLHSWEFMIKAQLNGSRSLRLRNLWPITGPTLCFMPFINSSIRKFKHTVFLLLIRYFNKIKPNERRKAFWQQSNKTCGFNVLRRQAIV